MACKTFTIYIYASLSACMLVWFMSLVFLLIWQEGYLFLSLSKLTGVEKNFKKKESFGNNKTTFDEIRRYGDFLMHPASSLLSSPSQRDREVCVSTRERDDRLILRKSQHAFDPTHMLSSLKEYLPNKLRLLSLSMESGDYGRWISTPESWGEFSSKNLLFFHLVHLVLVSTFQKCCLVKICQFQSFSSCWKWPPVLDQTIT